MKNLVKVVLIASIVVGVGVNGWISGQYPPVPPIVATT